MSNEELLADPCGPDPNDIVDSKAEDPNPTEVPHSNTDVSFVEPSTEVRPEEESN